MDFILAEIDAVKPRSEEWRKGPIITTENLKRGTGVIQRVTAKEWFNAKSESKPAANTMWLGKHKGMLLVDLRDNEPGYWSWACAEISGFRTKMEKLGLLDDE